MAESIRNRTNAMAGNRDVKQLELLLQTVLTDLAMLHAVVTELKADYNAHVHGGITAGAANSAAPDLTTAAAVNALTLVT